MNNSTSSVFQFLSCSSSDYQIRDNSKVPSFRKRGGNDELRRPKENGDEFKDSSQRIAKGSEVTVIDKETQSKSVGLESTIELVKFQHFPTVSIQ